LERLPNWMCCTFPHKSQKIHAVIVIITISTTWQIERIHYTLWSSTLWIITCTHYPLGHRKWCSMNHKWNHCIHSRNIKWKHKWISRTHRPHANVMRKQLLIYGNKCNHKTFQNQCKYGFPFNAHSKHHSKFNNYMNHWEYYQPRHEDCNVVPYHESLLLLWGVHLNIQCILSSYWSYYLFKYAMKCEPHGTINLNKKNQNV
jgi:hypothetical protein